MTRQEFGGQMTGLNISAAIMPDTRRGVKEQLMQKDLPEEVTLLRLSQIVKAEHREALRLTLVHPGIEIDQPLIEMIISRPVEEWPNKHKQKAAGKNRPSLRTKNQRKRKNKNN